MLWGPTTLSESPSQEHEAWGANPGACLRPAVGDTLGAAGSVLKAAGTLAGRRTIQLRWQSTHLGHQPSQTRQETMGRQMAPMPLLSPGPGEKRTGTVNSHELLLQHKGYLQLQNQLTFPLRAPLFSPTSPGRLLKKYYATFTHTKRRTRCLKNIYFKALSLAA